jgi:predicted CxxxxCH...CXXCH cytochrome family protein
VTGDGSGTGGENIVSTVEVRDDTDHLGQQQTDAVTTTVAVACTRNAPTFTMGADQNIAPAGSAVYTLDITNNDTAACPDTTFDLSILSETGNTGNFTLPSVLSSATVTIAAGASDTSVTVEVRDDTNHSGQQQTDPVTTTVVAGCTRNAPTFTMGVDRTIFPAGSTAYTLNITNNDTAACADSTWNITILSETGDTGNFTLPSVLSSATVTIPANTNDTSVTLTVTGNGSGTGGEFIDSTVRIQDNADHSGQDQNDIVRTTIVIVSGDGMLLKRSQEETCHACHKTDQNRVPADADWDEAIKSHNSTNTSSAKWGGNWGVAGGQYGEFVCTTCHTSHDTTNIYLIKETITTPDGSNWGSSGLPDVTVDFRVLSGSAGDPGLLGQDAGDTPRASSNRICEVCHTYDATQVNGVNAHPYSVGVALPNHQAADATDCSGCHKHTAAFAPGGCDSCHGDPPVENVLNSVSTGGNSGLADNPDPTGSATAGAHDTHVNTLSFACSNCHTGQNMPENPNQVIDMGFSMFGLDGTGTTYNGQSAADGYRGNNNTTVTNTGTAGAGNLTCSSLYCHGSSIGGPIQTPVWDDAATGQCGDCHKITNADPPTLGSHERHAKNGLFNGTDQGLNLACSKCHSASAGAQGHVNGDVSWDLDNADNLFGGSATYNGADNGTTGSRAPSGAYQSCGTVYCHSSVQNNGATGGPASYASPTWGAASVGCDTCHGQAGEGDGQPSTGSHSAHAAAANWNFACSVCHDNGGDETTAHADRTINNDINNTYDNVTFGAALYSQGDNVPENNYGNCSSTACHGDASPAWGTAGPLACNSCHGDADGSNPNDANSVVRNADALGAHVAHMDNTDGLMRGAGQGVLCADCHTVPAAIDDAGHFETSGDAEVPFPAGSPARYNATVANYDNPSQTCDAVYCHGINMPNGDTSGTNRQPTWGTGALSGCALCHGWPPPSAVHSALADPASNDNVCNACHTHVSSTDDAFDDASLHIDGDVDVSGGSCTGCHDTGGPGTTGPNNRRAIVPEFGLAWSHKRTAGGTVTDNDCGVCHTEGDAATGTTTASHNNGVVELRNPDTGGAIASFADFTRDTTSAALEAWVTNVMNNLCLGCHDSDGAADASARVPGGTALRPFNTAPAHDKCHIPSDQRTAEQSVCERRHDGSAVEYEGSR